MKKIIITSIIFVLLGMGFELWAQNTDRSGQAGAPEVLINPWSRTTGMGSYNVANVNGLESNYVNVAGLAFMESVEVNFANTQWLNGTGIQINAVGVGVKIKNDNALALTYTTFGFGDIVKTETGNPDHHDGDAGLGTFSPNLSNLSLSYAKAFSNSIYGGVTARYISESVAEVRAAGISLDVGIQYITGKDDNVRFGVTLKNWSPQGMKFVGDGLTIRSLFVGDDDLFTTAHRGAKYEVPSQLNIGASYDFLMEEMRLTLMGTFSSNSFTKDQFILGAEYQFKKFFMLRAAYAYEKGINKSIEEVEKTNISKGLSAGASVLVPFSKTTNSGIWIDYAFRACDHFSGSHTFGLRLTY